MPNLVIRAAAAALPFTLVAAPAQAQADLSAAQIEAAARFGLPALFEGFRVTCQAELADDGYVARNAARLSAKFADGADAHWPEARDAMFALGGEEGLDPDMLAGMPDEALKPFVTSLLQQMAATELEPAQCPDVERGLELLDPLPADNIAGLIGFVVDMAGDADDAEAATAVGE